MLLVITATNGASEGEGVRWEVITLCPCGGGIRVACATVAPGAAGCVVLWCCWLRGAALFHLLLVPILNLVHRIAVAAARAKIMQLFILFEYQISLFLLNITALRVSLPVASWQSRVGWRSRVGREKD